MNITYSGKFEVLYCPKCKELTSQELIMINSIEAYLCTGCESVIVDNMDMLWEKAQEAYTEYDDELDEMQNMLNKIIGQKSQNMNVIKLLKK